MFIPSDVCLCDPTYLTEAALGLTQGVNAQECATSAGVSLCVAFHSIAAVVFSIFLMSSLFQVVRFWFVPSDKLATNINLLYGAFALICSVRIIRYAMMVTELDMHENYYHGLFYAPLLLVFSSITILVPTWMELYSIVSGKGLGTTVRLPNTAFIANLVVLTLAITLFHVDTRFTALPMILGTLGAIFLFFNKCFRKFKNAKIRRGCSRAANFPKVTYLTVSVIVTMSLLIASLSVFTVLGHWYNNHSFYFVRHITWISLEILFAFFQLKTLKHLSFASVLPLPVKTEQLTPEWITTLLRENGIIEYRNKVKKFCGEKLRGGCHSKVHKIELEYSDKNQRGPRAVVVKVLSHEKGLLEKLALYFRYSLPLACLKNRNTDYLTSYSTEARFYKELARKVRGIRIPKVYYNYEDTFHSQFGLVMQDVVNSEADKVIISGQPDGFTYEESSFIMQKLAKFHASFWNYKNFSRFKLWEVGGFYTGDKRINDRLRVVEAWQATLSSFAPHIELRSDVSNLGDRLLRNMDAILSVYKAGPKTLVHGDFKLSNLFIASPPEYSGLSSAPSCASSMVRPSNIKSKTDVGVPTMYVIDWQWVGKGVGIIDVAYFLGSSCVPELVTIPTFRYLCSVYHQKLCQKGVTDYSFNDAWTHFRLCIIDYVFYLIVCKWHAMSLEDVRKYKEKTKDGLPLRSLPHMEKLIAMAVEFLDELSLH